MKAKTTKTITVSGKQYTATFAKSKHGGYYYAVKVGYSELTGFSAGEETDAIAEAKAHIAEKVPS